MADVEENHVTTRAYGHIHDELLKCGITIKRGPKALMIRDGRHAVVIDSEMPPPSIGAHGESTYISVGSARFVPKQGTVDQVYDLISELVFKFYSDLR